MRKTFRAPARRVVAAFVSCAMTCALVPTAALAEAIDSLVEENSGTWAQTLEDTPATEEDAAIDIDSLAAEETDVSESDAAESTDDATLDEVALPDEDGYVAVPEQEDVEEAAFAVDEAEVTEPEGEPSVSLDMDDVEETESTDSDEDELPAPDEELAEEGIVAQGEDEDLFEGSAFYYDMEPIDSDAALAGYIEACFARELGGEEYADPLVAQTNLTDNEEAIYSVLKQCVAEVAAGTRTSTTFSVPKKSLSKTSFTASDLGLSSIIESNGRPSQKAISAFQTKLVNLNNVLSALRANCPYELYWMGDGSVSMRMNQIGYTSKRIYLAGDVEWIFPVSSSYAAGTNQVNPSTASRVKRAVTTAKSIVSSSAGKSVYDRLAYFKQRICALTSYNTAAARGGVPYGDPWQMVSVFDGDASTTVVCEGYAKAFKYLCDLANISGVDCRLATGLLVTSSRSEAHMWNVVQMPDGRNYLVDVTNCDAGTVGADSLLFLVPPASGSVNAGYTFKPSGSTVKYTYDTDCKNIYTTGELTLANTKYGTAVASKSISKATVSIANGIYTGSEVRPTLTVTYDKATLASGTDYAVEYRNNVSVGTATAIISGKGAYGGSKTVTFKITPRSIDEATVSHIDSQAYTGSSVTPALTVKYRGNVLTKGKDYTAAYRNNVNKGTASVVITGIGSFTGTRTASFTIVDASEVKTSLNSVIISDIASQLYKGTALTPTVTLTYQGKKLVQGTDYSVVYRNNTNVGLATVTFTGKGQYTGTRTTTFSITGRAIASASVATIPNQVWTGKALTPTVTLTDGGKKLVQGTDYTVSYSNNNSVGTATVTITGKGTYQGSMRTTFKVVAASKPANTPTPAPAPTPVNAPSFSDVPTSHWAYKVVTRAASLKLITGYSDGTFGADKNVTRGQIATILWRMAGQPSAVGVAKSFPDVTPDAYYYKAVAWASSVGVVSGFGSGEFGPGQSVTREQLAVMLANYAGKVSGLNVTGSYADFAAMPDAGNVSSWAAKAVGWCFKRGILSGGANGVNPKGEATRAQAAKMIVALYDLVY